VIINSSPYNQGVPLGEVNWDESQHAFDSATLQRMVREMEGSPSFEILVPLKKKPMSKEKKKYILKED
jgi:hypothetical protein